ncbi:P2X purinoceptor 7-like [Ornithodoros turicata]|uniref:P2X purinoceptor 7-like n=1 Tax=Ornithodoros turicata TaxID=34597 RepID=UPI0031396675
MEDFEVPAEYRHLMPLSEWEIRTLQRCKIMNCTPYGDTPYMTPGANLAGVVGNHVAAKRKRRDSSDDWCTCGVCRSMQTRREDVCCRNVPAAVEKKPEGCVTTASEFQASCLTDVVIRLALQSLENQGVFMNTPLHERYRYVAYRQCASWLWGHLGEGNRHVLPSCVVWAIREKFPSTYYTGFRPTL